MDYNYIINLKEALQKIVKLYGIDIISDPKLINILNDYNAFSNEKYAKNVVKLIVERKYINKIIQSLDDDNMSLIINQYSYELHNEYGISKEVSLKIFNSIIMGLGYNSIITETESTKQKSNLFEIDLETEKRLNSYIELLGIPYDECGNLLTKQGKIDDAIQLYKIGTNKGEVHCLVELIKLYMNRNGKENDNETKILCNKYFNSFIDIIGDGDECPDLSEINEEYLDMYAKGFYEIIPIALEHKKTRLFHFNIEFFIIGALGIRLYEMLTNEMEGVNEELNKMDTKRKIGLLKMEDYSYFSLLESKRESIIEFKTYLHSLINKIRKYDGQRIVFNRINE